MDKELIVRLARIYEGNALRHERNAAEKRRASENETASLTQEDMLAASSMVIAAGYWSLIDGRQGSAQYKGAATRYRALGHEYWMVLALASGDSNQMRTVSAAINSESTLTPLELGFGAVANQLVERRDSDGGDAYLTASWERLGNVPVGRLGIPLNVYMRCADTIRTTRAEQVSDDPRGRTILLDSFGRSCSDYFSRASEVIGLAAHDRFHWSRGLSTILPAEPEAVAMAVAMSAVAHDVFHTRLSRSLDIDWRSRLVMEVADSLREAAENGASPDESKL